MSDLSKWEWKAREELNDIPELRQQRLDEFRRRLIELESEEFRPLLHDDFLMMFLRTRKFDVERALRSYRNTYKLRTVDPDVFWPVGTGPLDYRHVVDLPVCKVMPKKNHDGSTVVVCSYRYYDMDLFNILDVVSMSTLMCAHLLRDPHVQTYGVRCVVDFRHVHLKYLRAVHPKYLKAIVLALRDGCPARLKGFHNVFVPRFAKLLHYALKALFSQKHIARTHFHQKLSELHEHIDPDVLPDDLGGTAGRFTPGAFEEDLLASHEEYVHFSHYGYV